MAYRRSPEICDGLRPECTSCQDEAISNDTHILSSNLTPDEGGRSRQCSTTCRRGLISTCYRVKGLLDQPCHWIKHFLKSTSATRIYSAQPSMCRRVILGRESMCEYVQVPRTHWTLVERLQHVALFYGRGASAVSLHVTPVFINAITRECASNLT